MRAPKVWFVAFLSLAVGLSAEPLQQATVSADGRVRKKKKKAKKVKPPPSPPMFVAVDSLADSGGSCPASTQPPTDMSPYKPHGTCTLRAAIDTANGLAGGMPLVVLLRPGRFRLAAALPELTGRIELRGADGPFPRRKKAKATDATDVDDPDFRPGGHRLAPIGTTIDGGNEFQLLRTAYGSKVRLQSLRLENGVAMAEGSADKRASLGGALNALGALTVNNSVVRRCHAINGGAIYSESKVHLMHSVLAENVADRCGGLIYTAGPAKVDRCEVTANRCGHFDCRVLDTDGQPGAPRPSWRKAAARPNAGSFDDDDDDDDDTSAPEGEDATGAIAEGPSLLRGTDTARESSNGGAGKKKPVRATRRRKASKLSVSEEDELDELGEEVDARLDEELRQEALEQSEEDEADEAAEATSAGDALPPPACDPERHGGKGGQPHELSCSPGLWRTGGKMPSECIRWAATSNCSVDDDSAREQSGDLSCYDFVPSEASGWCECAGGHTTARTGCGHEPFTCQRECRLMRERRRRSKGKPPRNEAAIKLYAIGAFGATSDGFLDGFGLICSDGSRTALVGTKPSAAAKAWEYVCPGWDLCRDANTTWDAVSTGPLCAAWAARGECATNPGYMREQCMRSCNACPPQPLPTLSTPRGLARLDVRAGLFVDAVRLHCAPAAVAAEATEPESIRGMDGPGVGADGPRVSDWYGGPGGDTCPLHCEGDGSAASYRSGGLVEGLIASGGERIDRLELGRCTGDLEV